MINLTHACPKDLFTFICVVVIIIMCHYICYFIPSILLETCELLRCLFLESNISNTVVYMYLDILNTLKTRYRILPINCTCSYKHTLGSFCIVYKKVSK